MARAFTFLLTGFLLLCPSNLLGQDSWKGKTVFIKKPGLRPVLKSDDPEKKTFQPFSDTHFISYKVLDDKDGFLKVGLRSAIGWLKKEETVPAEEAVAFFTTQIKGKSVDPDAYQSRSAAWSFQGEIDKAIEDMDHAIRLRPKASNYRNSRALLWVKKKDYDKAIEDYTEAIAHKKSAIYFTNRAAAHSAKRDYEKAIADYESALNLERFIGDMSTLARLLATCPEAKLRDGKKAVRLANEAVRRSEGKVPFYLDTLAAALAESGDFAEAVAAQEKALRDADFERISGPAARARLALYRAGKAFHAK